MSREELHVIVAIETPILQTALLQALQPLDCSPALMLPAALLEESFSGFNLILLETGEDNERLATTCEQIWAQWGETKRACFIFLAYPLRKTWTSALTRRLWSIGPEMTVIVPGWQPESLYSTGREAYALTKRVLRMMQTEENKQAGEEGEA